MKILVDADACPVKQIIVQVAKKNNIEVMMFCDTAHEINDGYSQTIVVDKSADSVDFALIQKAVKGDIVVTQDYGVAAMALSKLAFAINQNGLIYDNENIDRLLMERYENRKIRQSGGRHKNLKKRTAKNDESFRIAFEKLLSSLL